MARKAIILSCSITKEQEEALNNLSLSPSMLLQGAIIEQIEKSKSHLPRIKELELKVQNLAKKIQYHADFLAEKDIPIEDFFTYVNERDHVA